MAGVHDVLLLWFDILGLCLPPLFFVSEHVRTLSLTNDSYHHSASLAYSFSQQKNSMRYSRMLEESSFANRKADYFWLLFLSSLMLLVRPPSPLPHAQHSHANISFIPRACPRYSTSPFSPPRSPTCPSTSGRAGTPRRPSRSLACSP